MITILILRIAVLTVDMDEKSPCMRLPQDGPCRLLHIAPGGNDPASITEYGYHLLQHPKTLYRGFAAGLIFSNEI